MDSTSSSTEEDRAPRKRRKLIHEQQYAYYETDSQSISLSVGEGDCDSPMPISPSSGEELGSRPDRSFLSLRSYDSNTIDTASNLSNELSLTSNAISPGDLHMTSDEIVCFGMATGLPVVLGALSTYRDGDTIDVLYSPSNATLLKLQGKTIVGRITNADVVRLLSGLVDDSEIQLQLYIIVNVGSAGHKKPAKQASMNIIVYGLVDLFEDVGDFFQANECYLQKPRGCDRNVRYRNPHCISGSEGDAPWTFDIDLAPEADEEVITSSDILAGLETEELLPEAEQPHGIKTGLYNHQKQALFFMQRREKGWLLRTPTGDVWSEEKLASGKAQYVNNITNDRQRDAPPDFRGGILADDMGLGKTLTVIALIASDRRTGLRRGRRPGRLCPARLTPTGTTLIVVPSSLLQQWQTQLQEHLVDRGPYAVRWTIHYGQDKLYSSHQIKQHQIIITSYQTLASEYRTHSSATPSILFTSFWHRIVLDEAHCVRNRSTTRTQAVLKLEGLSRWAVTGTPVQNRLSDFASLVEILRIYPYCNQKAFKADIVDVWKQEDEKVALERVTRLFKFISIRRTKNILDLPEKKDLIHHLNFSDAEMKIYHQLESPIVEMIETELESEEPACGQYVNALLKINELRKFCNLGVSAQEPRMRNDMEQLSDTRTWNPTNARIILEDLINSGQIACSLCDTDIHWSSGVQSSDSDGTSEVYITQCLKLACTKCYQEQMTRKQSKGGMCDCHQACHIAAVPLIPSEETDATYPANMELSTKVLALKRELHRFPDEKCVVFSSWTTTLNMISRMLKGSDIKYVRIDGSVPPKKRTRALQRFERRSSVRVMLISISCGAEGLNLTAASRIYLMEPQWNPNLEAQALARVYRLGQTKNVTTTRFIMKDSIENHVINIQDQKKHLGDLLLSQQKGAASTTRVRLQHLRRLLQ